MMKGVFLFSFSDIFFICLVVCFNKILFIWVELVKEIFLMIGLVVNFLLIGVVLLVVMILKILGGKFVFLVKVVKVKVESGVYLVGLIIIV